MAQQPISTATAASCCPPNLRRELELESQTVWLDYYNGGFNAFGKKIFEERMQRATVNLADKVKTLRKKGFK